jgi:transposase
VDVGKHEAVALVADAAGERLVSPFTFTLDRPGLAQFVQRVDRVAAAVRGEVQIEVGVEAAGHYHRPVTASSMLPSSWTLIELNPAHVTEQRRVLGKRGIKTDQIDLAAMFDLLVAGRGLVVVARSEALQQLQAWAAMRHRRIGAVIAVKNQLLGQMDRAFPGVGRCVSSLLETKVGRLVIAEFAEPARLARLGVERFRRFAAARDVIVSREVAERFVAAARAALPLDGAATARELVAADLELLERLEGHADEAERRIAELLPRTPFRVLTTTPGWATVRAGRYGAALGEPSRWPTARQVYRAAGLTPKTYESAGTRYDGQICREGSVELRGALLELGMGLWLCEPTSRAYAVSLKARGKPAGIIACALARRANKIAFAMVRDQTPYQPGRWSR